MYVRVTYDGYIEGEYESIEAAEKEFLEHLEDVDVSDLGVEVFDDETGKWGDSGKV